MANFEIAYKITSDNEGGFSNKSTDKGGFTYAGISRVMNPNWQGWSIIDSFYEKFGLKQGQFICNPKLDSLIKLFYKQNYWDKNRLSEITSQDVANEIYDIGVNMGTGFAAYILQSALNLLNGNQKFYKDIAEDMVIGSETLTIVNKFIHTDALVKTINGLRFMKYIEICKKDKTQEENLLGWLTRC